MSCNRVQPRLSAYLDGEMSGVEMLQFRSHINSCRDCQNELDGLRSVQAVLRDLPTAPEPSEAMIARIRAGVTASRTNYLRLALVVAVPALCWAIFAYNRPHHDKVQDRDLIINRQLAKDQIFDAGSDPASGASLVHYTNFEAR